MKAFITLKSDRNRYDQAVVLRGKEETYNKKLAAKIGEMIYEECRAGRVPYIGNVHIVNKGITVKQFQFKPIFK